jgi:hypothetical protein
MTVVIPDDLPIRERRRREMEARAEDERSGMADVVVDHEVHLNPLEETARRCRGCGLDISSKPASALWCSTRCRDKRRQRDRTAKPQVTAEANHPTPVEIGPPEGTGADLVASNGNGDALAAVYRDAMVTGVTGSIDSRESVDPVVSQPEVVASTIAEVVRRLPDRRLRFRVGDIKLSVRGR